MNRADEDIPAANIMTAEKAALKTVSSAGRMGSAGSGRRLKRSASAA
jgi:hypothetical protein